MKDRPPHEALRRLFEVIVREAEHNPALAEKLVGALAQPITVDAIPKAVARKQFNASQFHAINILRLHGEDALRGRLEQVKAVEDLKSVAKASGLVLSGNASKARPLRADLISGIIAAAKHYDAQRSTATT
jgi:hypothetical protein